MVLHELGLLLVVSGVGVGRPCLVFTGAAKGRQAGSGLPAELEGKAGAFLASFAVEESSPPIWD